MDKREPAVWTGEVIAAWPEKKSKVVQGFLTAISPATQAKVHALAPATQACVAMSVALHICEGDSADSLTEECLLRLQSGTQTQGHVAGVMSPRPATSKVQMQLIFVASEPLIALVLAKCFSSTIQTVCPGAFLLLPLVIVSQKDAPSVHLQLEAERLKLTIDPATTSMQTLEQFIESNKANFKQYAIKTVFISICGAVTEGSAPPRQRHATSLHSAAYRFLWQVTRCSHSLRATTGDDGVVEVVFARAKLDEDMKTELEKVFGQTTATMPSIYNQVVAAPSVFCTPTGSAMVPVCRADEFQTQDIDGWSLPAEPQITEDMSGGLISFIARTSEIGVFQERPLTVLEQNTINNFTMTHVQTGEKRLVSRDWWLRWFGYNKTSLMTHINTQFPCHQRIFSVTGAAAVSGSASGEPCGKLRYCSNCERAFTILDGTFSLPIMVDATVALVVKARQLWVAGQDDVAWKRHGDVNRMHMCSESCPHAA